MNTFLRSKGSKAWVITSAIILVLVLALNIASSAFFDTVCIVLNSPQRTKLINEQNQYSVLEGYNTREKAAEYGDQVTLNAAKEGFILLKNLENALPLAKGAKVSVFGKNSVNIAYGGSGSGGGKGSVGLRGPGETQLEMDQRIIKHRITLLKQRLAEIDQQKSTQRKNRGRLIRVALVGYTNVGKSTIMNLLSKSDVFAENKLFATLDTPVRKVVIDNLPFLLADTVGFIRKLPTDLVESFKSTLDETREADLLVHVVDISHPDFEEQIQVVEKTLADLGCAEKPSMIVFNKIDNYSWIEKEPDDLTPPTKENVSLDELKRTWMAKLGDCIFISALEKQNIDEFREAVYQKVRELHVQKYPYNDFLYNIED